MQSPNPAIRTQGRPVLAFGPEMPGWGSWDWVGADMERQLAQRYETRRYRDFDFPDCDVLFVVKHAPPTELVRRAAGRSHVVYLPVDFYGSAADIDADAAMLRWCSRVLVHCERLRRYFAPYSRTEYIDHHVKFVAPAPEAPNERGPILWVGVRSNLAPLIEWVNANPPPGELWVLTNLEEPLRLPNQIELGFRPDLPIRIENWTPDRQLEWTAIARAAIDIKGDDFRSRHKPPAKAIDFLASGLPLAMNPDSSSAEHLAKMGFELATPNDTARWLSREYWEETRQFGAALATILSIQRLTSRFDRVIRDLLAEPRIRQ